eukprot:768333-Hanusia_phi.AAC.3
MEEVAGDVAGAGSGKGLKVVVAGFKFIYRLFSRQDCKDGHPEFAARKSLQVSRRLRLVGVRADGLVSSSATSWLRTQGSLG